MVKSESDIIDTIHTGQVITDENGKIKDRMERAKMESKLHDIQRLVDRIPPEVLAELKRQQRHTRER